MMTDDQISKIEVELRQDLKILGIRKDSWVETRNDWEANQGYGEQVSCLPANTTESITTFVESFSPGAYWKMLILNKDTQNNPVTNKPFHKKKSVRRQYIARH